MDEILGPRNFLACCVWQKRYSRENRGAIGDAHEYVVIYAADLKQFEATVNKLPFSEKQAKVYKNPNDDSRGTLACHSDDRTRIPTKPNVSRSTPIRSSDQPARGALLVHDRIRVF
jgi:hypothetical protein